MNCRAILLILGLVLLDHRLAFLLILQCFIRFIHELDFKQLYFMKVNFVIYKHDPDNDDIDCS